MAFGQTNIFSEWSTDEDAFRALQNKGWTICIGKSKDSSAQYYLNNSREVSELLQRILQLKETNPSEDK